MKVSAVRLYHPAPWAWFYSYQVVLITLRMMELGFVVVRYLLFRAPVLVIWTRAPGLRNTRTPYGELARVLAPFGQRASVTVAGGQFGAEVVRAKNSEEMSEVRSAFLAGVNPPSRVWSVAGCVIRGLLTELGPSFIKFGQILSMREEIPPSVKNELQLLQDRLPPMSFKEVKSRLERELTRPIDEVFEYVEPTPIASGSLAQVHRAKLRKEQEEVALKIQRSHMEGTVALDTVIICDILFGFIKILLPLLNKSTDVTVLTSSYRKSLKGEIDFVMEERNQSRCYAVVQQHPIQSQAVKIARTYQDYTTTKLLTMELVKGYHRLDRIMDELTPEEVWGIFSTTYEGYPAHLPMHILMAGIGAQMAEGIVRYGWWHGDFHLGNLYILRPQWEGDKWKIFLCDFGMMLGGTKEELNLFRGLIASFMYSWDGKKAAEEFGKVALLRGQTLSKDTQDKLETAMTAVVERGSVEVRPGTERAFFYQAQRGSPTTMMGDAVYRVAALGVKLPDYLWLLFKNLGYAGNLGATYWGSLECMDLFIPHVKRWVKDRTLNELDELNVINMQERLPDALSTLREYDRKEVLKGLLTGEDVIPLEPLGGYNFDDDRIRSK